MYSYYSSTGHYLSVYLLCCSNAAYLIQRQHFFLKHRQLWAVFLLKHRHIAIISPVKCRNPTVLVIKTIIEMLVIRNKVVTLHQFLC